MFGTLSKWGSIIHLTIGNNEGRYGDRVPAIWTRPKESKLHIASAVNGEDNYVYDSDKIPVNKKVHIVVDQSYLNDNKYQYSIYIDGKQVHTTVNNKAEEFENVKVYIANPWHDAANGKIENVKLENRGKNLK